jgi:hypothetical protein
LCIIIDIFNLLAFEMVMSGNDLGQDYLRRRRLRSFAAFSTTSSIGLR